MREMKRILVTQKKEIEVSNINQYLKYLRLKKGYTLQQLAKILDSNPSTISLHERDKRKLSASLMFEAERVLNLDIGIARDFYFNNKE